MHASHRVSVTPSPIAPLLQLSFRMTSPVGDCHQTMTTLPQSQPVPTDSIT